MLPGDIRVFSFESRWDVPVAATRDPADNRFSACVRRLRVSNNSAPLGLKDASESLPSVDSEASESNLSPNWMVFWLLVKLLSLRCCRVVCSVDG